MLRCRSRQCPPGRDVAYRADRFLADGPFHPCTHSGYQRQSQGYPRVGPWSVLVRRCIELKRSEMRIRVVQVASAMEGASAVAAQVVALRGYSRSCITVTAGVIRHNAVLQGDGAAVVTDGAITVYFFVASDRAAVDRDISI